MENYGLGVLHPPRMPGMSVTHQDYYCTFFGKFFFYSTNFDLPLLLGGGHTHNYVFVKNLCGLFRPLHKSSNESVH